MKQFLKSLGHTSFETMFLAQSLDDCMMSSVFLTIWAVARNPQQLEKFHQQLPDNCRLLRKDFLSFKKLWKLWKKGNIVSSEEKVDPSIFQVLLAQADYRNNLEKYYYHALNKMRKCPYNDHELTKAWLKAGLSVIYSHPCRIASESSEHFTVVLTNIGKMKLGLFFENNQKEELVIRLVTSSNSLTEPITYHLLQLPESMITGRAMRGPNGSEVDFRYSIKGRELTKILSSLSVCKKGHLATDLFLELILTQMREIGLPIPQGESIVPIIDLKDGFPLV